MKLSTSCTLDGVGHSEIASIFVESTTIPSLEIMCPR